MAALKILFVSGSFGLGHVTRDLAVAREVRRRDPTIQIAWLSASPTSELLTDAGETLVPECREYRCETDSAEQVGKAGQLSLTKYVYRTLGKWIHNARVIGRTAQRGSFDLVIGDETYEVVVAHVLGVRALPKAPLIIFYDFWGVDVTTGSLLERLGAWCLNLIWSRQHRVTARRGNAALFIGEPEDIPNRRFGLLLPNRRDYALKYSDIIGYILTFAPSSLPAKAQLRSELGYGSGPLLICTVGGTAVGRELLELCGRAYPLSLAQLPGLQLVLVCGPRIDPEAVVAPAGVVKRGMVNDLYRHFAAADLVITQGGGTTTLELTALGVPFLFFPVKAQAEQEVTIADRLARHQAGVKLSMSDTTPQTLAQAIAKAMREKASSREIPCSGSKRAADIILERLGRGIC